MIVQHLVRGLPLPHLPPLQPGPFLALMVTLLSYPLLTWASLFFLVSFFILKKINLICFFLFSVCVGCYVKKISKFVSWCLQYIGIYITIRNITQLHDSVSNDYYCFNFGFYSFLTTLLLIVLLSSVFSVVYSTLTIA